MNKRLFAALALSLPLMAQAGIPGFTFKAGAYQWWQDWDGDARAGSLDTRIDANSDLGFDDDSGLTLYVAFEHFLPLIPNIKLQRSDIEISGRNTLQRNIVFDGRAYAVGTEVRSKADLSHIDGTLYWSILNNIVSLDVGLTARNFDGELEVAGSGQRSRINLSGTLPLLYLAGEVKLPFTGLYANAEINALSVRDSGATDYRLGLGYGIGPINLEMGFRSFELDYEDGNDRANLTVDGYYFGALFRF